MQELFRPRIKFIGPKGNIGAVLNGEGDNDIIITEGNGWGLCTDATETQASLIS
jgi:hypothetical protein